MALSIDEANTVSSKYFDKTLTSQVYEKCPFYAKLKSIGNVSTDGGTQIQWGIRYKKSDLGGFIGPRDQVNYSQVETRTGAVLDWKYLHNHAMISLDEQTKNSGKAEIINLLSDKATELREDMLDDFATALYATAPGANDISSLYEIVDTATTYGGIAVADAAEWAAAVEDSTTTELVLYGSGSISESINAATFGTSKPDIHFTTRNLWSKFESLIEPQKRYYSTQSAMAKAGFTSLGFHDGEIIADPYCPTSAWFGLDSSQFEIRYHPKYNMKTSAWTSLEQAGYPYAMVKNVIWAGNILCRMRKTSFRYTALDYTL